jgi:hypothetical protein
MTAVQGLPGATSLHFGTRRVAGNPAGELEAISAVLVAVEVPHVPDAWRTPSFARRVEAARAQLRAARSRSVLAASFEREACRLGPATPGSVRRADAVRAAYALRWLELATGAELPSWHVWLDRARVVQAGDLLG